MKLEWLKKHPYAAAGAILVGLIVVYMLFRKSSGSSGGGIASLAAGQQQGQLQLAQLNAQEQAQQSQQNAQLAATEYQSNLAATQSQNQLLGSLAGTIIPMQLQSQLAQSQLGYQYQTQQSLVPLESTLIKNDLGGGKNTLATNTNELALLLGQGSVPTYNAAYSNIGTASAANNPLNTLAAGLFSSNSPLSTLKL